jgi:hypothetical protein
MQKKSILVLIIIALIITGTIIGNNKTKKWYDDLDYYSATRIFLEKQVKYPDTFEFIEYPKAKFGTEEEKLIQVSGEFKCANAFGVYTTYKYVILFEVKGDWVIKNYNIT